MDIPDDLDPNTLNSKWIQVFMGKTTFESELTIDANLSMLEKTAKDLGAVKLAHKLEIADILGVDAELKTSVVKTAKRFGKARFAQTATNNVTDTCKLPEYIIKAIEWLRNP